MVPWGVLVWVWIVGLYRFTLWKAGSGLQHLNLSCESHEKFMWNSHEIRAKFVVMPCLADNKFNLR